MNERDLLREIKKYSGRAPSHVKISIGDDAAVLRLPVGKDLVATTDMLVENIDFRRSWCTAEDVGWKAHAAALSDLAAMGAKPLGSLLSLAVPSSWNTAKILAVAKGAAQCGKKYGSLLIGGDLSSTQGSMVCSLTCMGSVQKNTALTRKGAKPGHVLALTGTVGSSGAVLAKLLARRNSQPAFPKDFQRLIKKFFRPVPRLQAGHLFASRKLVSAAIDVSDGLALDLHRLCRASNVGAEIFAADLPLAKNAGVASHKKHQDPVAHALASGEEYELLLSISRKNLEAAKRASAKSSTRLTVIGKVRHASKGITLVQNSVRRVLEPRGFSHSF